MWPCTRGLNSLSLPLFSLPFPHPFFPEVSSALLSHSVELPECLANVWKTGDWIGSSGHVTFALVLQWHVSSTEFNLNLRNWMTTELLIPRRRKAKMMSNFRCHLLLLRLCCSLTWKADVMSLQRQSSLMVLSCSFSTPSGVSLQVNMHPGREASHRAVIGVIFSPL